MSIKALIALFFSGMVFLATALTGQDVITATGIQAGLAVHVGTTDGQMEIGLTNGGKMLVHGMALSLATRQAARSAIMNSKIYGIASIELYGTAAHLPYTTNLVNLLVVNVDTLGALAPSDNEISRVLAPGGVAYVKKSGDQIGNYSFALSENQVLNAVLTVNGSTLALPGVSIDPANPKDVVMRTIETAPKHGIFQLNKPTIPYGVTYDSTAVRTPAPACGIPVQAAVLKAHESLLVKVSGKGVWEVSVFTLKGAVKFKQTGANPAQVPISLRSFAPGKYAIRISSEGQSEYHGFVVK